jgi:hypothetical protein
VPAEWKPTLAALVAFSDTETTTTAQETEWLELGNARRADQSASLHAQRRIRAAMTPLRDGTMHRADGARID